MDQCQWSCQVQSYVSELPITRLIMGRQSFSTDAPSDASRKLAPGKFALGKLECTGRMEGSEGLQGPVGPPGPPGPKGLVQFITRPPEAPLIPLNQETMEKLVHLERQVVDTEVPRTGR